MKNCKTITVCIARDKINLSENGKILKAELEKTEVRNKFFSKIIENLEISKFLEYERFTDKSEGETISSILQNKNHSSIIAIQSQFKNRNAFISQNLK